MHWNSFRNLRIAQCSYLLYIVTVNDSRFFIASRTFPFCRALKESVALVCLNQAFTAVTFPTPRKYETVSQPVIA